MKHNIHVNTSIFLFKYIPDDIYVNAFIIIILFLCSPIQYLRDDLTGISFDVC